MDYTPLVKKLSLPDGGAAPTQLTHSKRGDPAGLGVLALGAHPTPRRR